MFESLENRVLMAFAASQSGGTLNVAGTNGNDQLVVVENAGSVTVRENQTGQEQSFTGVTRVNVLALAGTDRIDYTGNSALAFLSGGDASDQINVSDVGSGRSIASGGLGNDDIEVIVANNTFVTGDDGDDIIEVQSTATSGAGNGVTYLAGEAGNDTFILHAGTNDIHGGDGTDTVFNFGGTNTYTNIESIQSP